MDRRFLGKVLKLGNHVRADQIVPPAVAAAGRADEMLAKLFSGIDPALASRVTKGTIVVGGAGFGCGSPVDLVPAVLKQAGIPIVVAESFSRNFYRGAANAGLRMVEAAGVFTGVTDGDMIEVDLGTGLIRNVSRMRRFQTTPFPDFLETLAQVGGIEEYIRTKLQRRG